MKLCRPHQDPQGDQTRLRDLTCLLEQPSYQELRPCAGCTQPCSCSASLTCPCRCGPHCAQRAVEMSSEGDRYPIEPKIVALVFSFNCLRVCQPFWSCEGHECPDGSLHRVPQVWFYSPSLIYPRMMADWLTSLHCKKRITHPWHICVSYSEGGLSTGFSLEPDMKMMSRVVLDELQHDVAVLSETLVPEIRALARTYLDKYRNAA